jgi:hypothetical protein
VDAFVSKLEAYDKSLAREKPTNARARKKLSSKATPASYRVSAADTLARVALALSVSDTKPRERNSRSSSGVPSAQGLFTRPN